VRNIRPVALRAGLLIGIKKEAGGLPPTPSPGHR